MDNHQIIHKHTYNPFKAWHLLAIFIPSFIFFATIYFFSDKAEVKTSAASIEVATPKPKVTIQIGGTTIYAEKAVTEIEQRIGLSNHTFLPEDQGMIFLFKPEAHPQFWMKDMDFPIDIIWITENKIFQIDKNISVESNENVRQYKLYLPNQSPEFALQVNAGFADKNNLQVGDEVNFDILW